MASLSMASWQQLSHVQLKGILTSDHHAARIPNKPPLSAYWQKQKEPYAVKLADVCECLYTEIHTLYSYTHVHTVTCVYVYT